MGFDFFSQPRGPDIRISLFGDAATQGAHVGTEIPSATTAAIQGGLQGIKTGQEFQQNAANLEATQVRTQLTQQEIDAQRLQTQISQARFDTQELNKDTNDQTEAIQAQNGLQEAKNKQSLLKQGLAVSQALSSTDPNVQKSVLGPQYAPYMTANPREEEAVIRSLWSKTGPDGKPVLSEAEMQAYRSKVYTAQQLKYESALAKGDPTVVKTQQKYDAAFSDPYVKGLQGAVSSARGSNLTKAELASYELAPTGQYQYDDSGVIQNDANGNRVSSPPAFDAKTFDVIDPVTNKKVGTLPSKSAGLLSTAADAQSALGIAPFVRPKSAATQTSLPGGIKAGSAGASFVAPAPAPTPNLLGDAKDIQTEAQNASPATQAKVNAILAQKQSQNVAQLNAPQAAQAPAGTPTAGPTPTAPPASDPAYANSAVGGAPAQFQKSSFVDQAQSGALKDPVSLVQALAETPPLKASPEVQGVVDRVNSNEHLKDSGPLIRAMAAVESGGKEGAVSPTGVKGLLQVTEATARDHHLNRNIPAENVKAAGLYMKDLLHTFHGDVRLALAAYNGGQGRIQQAINLVGSTDFDDVVRGLETLQIENPKLLTKGKVKEIANYPSLVFNYLPHFLARA